MFGIKYIIRKRQLGDVLWIEPVIRQLAKRNRKVIVHTKFNILFENYPEKNVVFRSRLSIIEKIISKVEQIFNTNILFINLDGAYEKEPQQHFLHAYEKKAKVDITDEYPRLYLTKKEKEFGNGFNDRYVILHIESFSHRNYRHIYGIDWEQIVKFINQQGYKIIQIGEKIEKIDGCLSVSTNIRELMGLIYNCSLFIGLDSGPSHIAATLNKRCLIFFGAINPDVRHFRQIFKGDFLQQYCEFLGCYHRIPGVIDSPCKLYGDNEIPKCCVFLDDYLLKMIAEQINNIRNEDNIK